VEDDSRGSNLCSGFDRFFCVEDCGVADNFSWVGIFKGVAGDWDFADGEGAEVVQGYYFDDSVLDGFFDAWPEAVSDGVAELDVFEAKVADFEEPGFAIEASGCAPVGGEGKFVFIGFCLGNGRGVLCGGGGYGVLLDADHRN
jgi:hypothetical protein